MNYINKAYKVTDSDYDYLKPILKIFLEISNRLEFDFIIIGAIARDFLIKYVFEKDLKLRATADLDFAIMIDDWKKYRAIVNILIKEYSFEAARDRQRLFYGSYPVDILPFGKIAEGDTIFWPPDKDIEMSVTGFREVFDSGVDIYFDELKFKILSLEGLFVTKLVAWNERNELKKTDAEDLGTILYNYNEFYPNELFDEFSHLIESDNYDYLEVGVQIFAFKLKKFLQKYPKLLVRITEILQEELIEEDNARLVVSLSDIESKDKNLKSLQIILSELTK